MKKRVAAAIIIVIAAVLCIGIGVSADKVIYPCAKAKAVEYLCDKYDAEKANLNLLIIATQAHIGTPQRTSFFNIWHGKILRLSLNTTAKTFMSTVVTANFSTIISSTI